MRDTTKRFWLLKVTCPMCSCSLRLAVDGMSNDLSVPHQMSSVFLATKKVLQSSVTQSSLSIISRLKSTLNADVIIKAQALIKEVVANAVTAKGSGGWWHAAATLLSLSSPLLPGPSSPPTPTAQPAHHPGNGAEPPHPGFCSTRVAALRSPALSPASSHPCARYLLPCHAGHPARIICWRLFLDPFGLLYLFFRFFLGGVGLT